MDLTKDIGVLCDDQPFWDELARYLQEVNAKLFMAPASAWEILARRPLDLLVLGAQSYAELPARAHHLTTLVVGAAPRRLAAAEPATVARATWPLGREQLLAITSRLLAVPPRREYRSLARFFHPGQERTWFGRTTDFSLSGLAFSSEEPLEPGAEVITSFSLPNHRSSLHLTLRIIRKLPAAAGVAATYGARFEGLDARSTTIIEEFVRSA